MSRKIAPLGLTVVLAVGLALALMAGAAAPEAEITLVARDMAFFVKGTTVPNPTLEVRRGQAIRLRFENLDRGIDHDLTVRDLALATRVLRGNGSFEVLSFRAPRVAGQHEYVCALHGRMMRGTLVVH